MYLCTIKVQSEREAHVKLYKVMADTIKCYCLRTKEGKMHCPLSTDRASLRHTFNFMVRGEEIVDVEVDKAFVCKDERKSYCNNCPFK